MAKLRTIKRHEELPTPAYTKALGEVRAQSDRGAAIAGTAYLDLLLRATIETLLRPDKDVRLALFENRGALGDFSSRIHTAFALRLIGGGAYGDLQILRQIRNAFAHSAEAFDFERADVAVLCGSLWFPRHVDFKGKPRPTTARGTYTRSVEMIAQGLYEVIAPSPAGATLISLGPWPRRQAPSPGKSREPTAPA